LRYISGMLRTTGPVSPAPLFVPRARRSGCSRFALILLASADPGFEWVHEFD
jgi:hypothetical protein